jgi:type I restriction enzyme M protein
MDWWNDRKKSDLAWKVNVNDLKDWDLDIRNPNTIIEEVELSSSEVFERLDKSFLKSTEIIKSLKALLYE